MNILILSWRGPGHPNAGGAEIVTHEHAKAWVKAGHSVTLFTSSYEDAKGFDLIDGVKIIRRGGQAFGVKLAAFNWYLFENRNKFDLVFDHFHGLPFFTPLYVRTKKVSFIHEVAKEVWKLNSWPSPLNLLPAIIGPLFEPLIYKLFYRNISFVTVSQSTKDDLETWGIEGKNIHVVHNGVVVNKISPNISKNKEATIIFLGALSRDKGIEDAINIFSKLFKISNKLQFWIVGRGDTSYVKKLRYLSKNLGIDNNTKFWGYVSQNKKFELLKRGHILINPSIREGWGLVVIEAAAMGTPTVGYNVPGLRDSIIDKRTGLLSDSDPESCAKAVEDLLEDNLLYQKLVKNCIDWSSKFRWEYATKQSLKLIESL